MADAIGNNKLRIVIITQGLSPIVLPLVNNFKIVGIIESAPRRKDSFLGSKIKKIYSILRGKDLQFFCIKRNIPYFYLNRKNSSDLVSFLEKLKPDLGIVYSMSQLLKVEVINSVKYGFVNLHPSYLPNYRGPNPWFWQYYNMEDFFGVTIHWIDKGEDTGDIIYQEKFKVELGEPLKNVINRALNIGTKLIFDLILNFPNIPRIKQPEKSPTMRARNLEPYEYFDLIFNNNFQIQRIWHILNGSIEMFNKIFSKKGFIYIPIGYEVLDENNHFKNGSIYKLDNSKYCMKFSGGLVYFKKKLCFKKLLKDLLNE